MSTNNSNYELASSLALSPKVWPIRSTPCLQNAISQFLRKHPFAFSNQPNVAPLNAAPPWDRFVLRTIIFPSSKAEALACPQTAQESFREIISQLSPSATIAYTDGSLLQNNSVSCAVYIKDRCKIAQKLAVNTSIFSAELHGIRMALDFVVNLPETLDELGIISDSRSAVTAISSFNPSLSHPLISIIRSLVKLLHSSGTRVSYGIEGNEEADKLASTAHFDSSLTSFSDLLTASELKNSMKKDWLDSLHCRNHLLIGVYHLRFGFFPWKFHSNRKILSALHRIRSGHNRPNPR